MALWVKLFRINLSASIITGDLNGVLRGPSTKVFKISLNMPSIATDIKTPKWEGVTINFF